MLSKSMLSKSMLSNRMRRAGLSVCGGTTRRAEPKNAEHGEILNRLSAGLPFNDSKSNFQTTHYRRATVILC